MHRQSSEKGAVAMMTALFLVVIVGIAALAVDLGMQRVSKRDMQALSDLVALDMARQLDGETKAAPLLASQPWRDAQAQSIARNGGTLGDVPTVTVEVGHLGDPDSATPTVRPFIVATSDEVPTAVRVSSETAVDFAFYSGRGGVLARAIAESVKSACFSLGSYAARFLSSDSALLNQLKPAMDDLLHMPAGSLDVVSYQGLANAGVSLQEIAADSSIGTTTDLLTSSVNLGTLIQATVNALGRQSPPNSVAISALNKILQGHASFSTPVLVSTFLSMSPTDSAALETRLRVLDIVTGAVLVADGNHAVSIPNLQAQVPGVGNPRGDSSLTVIEGPQTGCGTVGSMVKPVTTAQVNGHIYFDFSVNSINNVPGIQGVVQTPKSTVDFTVALAPADGILVAPAPVCHAGTAADPDTESVQVHTALSTMSATTNLHFSARVPVGLPVFNALGVQIGINTTTLDVTFDQAATTILPMPDSTGTANLQIPPNDTTPVSTGSDTPLANFTIASAATNVQVESVVAGFTTVQLNSLATAALNASGGPAVTLAQAADLTVPLNQLVANVNALMTPLRTLLGLRVAGVDVFAVGRPTCNGAALRG